MKSDYIDRLKFNMNKQNLESSYIDLCCLYADSLLSKNLPVIFDINHLHQILKLNEIKINCYHEFEIYTNNKLRIISTPSKPLKLRQRWILKEILEHIPVNPCCHGFVCHRSIKTNAQAHINKKNVLCMDIHNFFPSINIQQVFEVFHNIGYTTSVSWGLAELCAYENKLPQGAPTSPILANIIFNSVDKQIQSAISNLNITYTRYADDLTFSSPNNIEFVVPLVTQIVSNNGFEINTQKTHLETDPHRKLVTGLVVTDTIKVPKYYKRKFNQELFYCEKYGVASHLKNCKTHKKINFKEYMYGKAYYIKMIEPDLGEKYLQRLDLIKW